MDWLPHTTRAALTGLRKRGYAIERTRREDKTTRYRATPPEGRPCVKAGASRPAEAYLRVFPTVKTETGFREPEKAARILQRAPKSDAERANSRPLTC
jgi:hypothetical protein